MTPTVVGHGTGVLTFTKAGIRSADIKNSICSSQGVCGTSPKYEWLCISGV